MKDKTTAGLLAIFLGWIGVHKFYLGNSKGGWIYLVIAVVSCCSISEILGIIDGIKYLMSSDEEFQAKVAEKKVFDFLG